MRSTVVVVLASLLVFGCGKKQNEGAAGAGSAGSAVAPAAPTTAAPAAPSATTAPPPSPAPTAGAEADPWKSETPPAPSAPGAPEGDGDDDPAPVANVGDDPAEPQTAEPAEPSAAPATGRAGLIAQVCARNVACGCPNEDCEEGFAKLTIIPNGVWACIAQQPCEMLCSPNSGAPGTVLYKTCMEGKMPGTARSGGGGGGGKSCRAASDCSGGYECCSGYCYEMGTSLWITACQMPVHKW